LASTGIQILDIRDPIDFESEHHPDAINIYIGRLPYVSKKELRRDQEIVIVSPSKVHIRRAAKILQNEGFTGLSGVVMCI
jgi:rhodanese-related sulfurtransferase